MVRAIDHVKHATFDKSSQAKRLQISQKNVEATEKTLEEANACIAIMKAKLGILSIEKDVTNQVS